MGAGRCWEKVKQWMERGPRVEGPQAWILSEQAATAARLCLEANGCPVHRQRDEDEFETLDDGTVARVVRFGPSTAVRAPAAPFEHRL